MSRPVQFGVSIQDAPHSGVPLAQRPDGFSVPSQSHAHLSSYSSDPLPIKLSANAPRAATIVRRVADAFQVTYTLDLAGVEIGDVKLHEVLDYVSPLDLETFENGEFVEEREVLEALEREQQDDKKARRERLRLNEEEHKEQLRFKLLASSSSHADNSDVASGTTGKHGRARPTYTHLFLKPHARKLKTSDLMDLESFSQSEDDSSGQKTTEHAGLGLSKAPFFESEGREGPIKRRRRKRDKVTGELLPLSALTPASQSIDSERRSSVTRVTSSGHVTASPLQAIPTKRPRRRRHPVTKELMPLGWVFKPELDDHHMATASQEEAERMTMGDLRISPRKALKHGQVFVGHAPRNSSTPDRITRVNDPQQSNLTQSPEDNIVLRLPGLTTGQIQKRTEVSQNAGVGSSSGPNRAYTPTWTVASQSIAKPSRNNGESTPLQRHLASNREESADITLLSEFQRSTRAAPSPRRQETGFHPPERQSQLAKHPHVPVRTAQAAKNGVPPKAKASMINPIVIESDSDGDAPMGTAPNAGEYFIEAILAHHMSDPRTHPAEFGKSPVMLYQVKWEGYDESTWEPMESFEDPSIVLDYRRRVGLDGGSSLAGSPEITSDRVSEAQNTHDLHAPIMLHQGNEIYRSQNIKHIHGHRSVAGHGKGSTRLYQIEWAHRRDMTWEPVEKFDSRTVFTAYEEALRNGTNREELYDAAQGERQTTPVSSDSGDISI